MNRVTRSLVLCVCFEDRCLTFCSFFCMAIVLSVLLRFTDFDYPFKLFMKLTFFPRLGKASSHEFIRSCEKYP